MSLYRARPSRLRRVPASVRFLPAKIAALLLATALAAPNPARADEGEWPPDRLATLGDAFWTAWRQRGLALGATDLWDGRGGGLATAAVALRGCSAAFVSPDGLLLTNHHCAFDALALASSPGRDYLKDGFVSHGRAGEVEARGGASRVWVLARTEDVTGRVRGPGSAFARAGDDRARFRAVERARKELVAECEARPDRRCLVVPFLDGLSWVREEQVELKDVRLVYAPPRDIGDFGGEVDNFRWPRHAGDFAVLRAYVAPDGSPAPFSAANVPYRPKAWLPVSTSGVKEGDALAILGYPGKTQRFLTAAAVDDLEGWFYPLRARTLGDLIGILERETEGDPAASLKVASAVKGFNNSRTNALGQIEGLRRNGVAARARREEERLSAWLASRPDAPPAWRSAARDVEAVLARDRQGRDRRFFLEELARLPGPLRSALAAVRRAEERGKPDLERDAGTQDRDLPAARQREIDLTRLLGTRAWGRAAAYLVARANAAGAQPVPAFVRAFGAAADEAAIARRLAAMDEKTGLGDEGRRLANLTAPLASLASSDDPYLALAVALAPEYRALREQGEETGGGLLRTRPPFLAALSEFRASEGRLVAPDANGTLRVSFARVKGYSPREALTASPITSLSGLLQKERGAEPFLVPPRVLEAIRRGAVGRWGDAALGTVPVDFLADGDTTGGNSGSPVVNGRGELVGLNFDRVWENVAGDFGWSPELSRNVCVDVRYALWLIDRVDGDRALVDELAPPRASP